MCGTVPKEIKIVNKINVVGSASGVEPSVHVAGAAKTLIAPVERREEAGEEDRDAI